MENKLKEIKANALELIDKALDLPSLENLELKFLGRKNGEFTAIMKNLKDLAENERKEMGQLANEVKIAIDNAFKDKKSILQNANFSANFKNEKIDITQTALPHLESGHFHPSTLIARDLENLFSQMGFMVLDGPELESDYYNFGAVNIPEDHPARDMQDTFYIKGHGFNSESPWVMRTQTSSMQVRSMQKYGAPLRAIVPGKVFRNEATDVRHEHTFYQLEGFAIDKNITMADLKGVMEVLVKHLYGDDTQLRLRPKYYPFVEPGVNGEVTCFLCKGKGCRVCKNSGWLEILGAGMIHPNVLKEGGIDPKIYQGFAFGFGLTRLVMLKYGIDDIRYLESGDLRFVKQF